ncbi:hypothetical protein Tco_0198628, partial [Tanacetum coccineum]
MMSKKMAELEDDFREFKAHTERRLVSLDMSIRAYRLEEDELKNLLLSLIQKSSSPVQSSRPITTKVPTKRRSVPKEDKDEQGKEEKGVVKFFEVGTDEENNSDIVFSDVGRIVYGKGNDTWADVGLKHGSYFL